MGSPFSGQDSIDLISIEGITTVGLLGAFFPPVLGVSVCHPGVGRSALKSGEVPYSVVVTFGEDSVCIPPANEGVGLGPSSSSGPVASRPPSWVGLAVILFTRAFHERIFHAWWLASGASGSQPSR